MSLIIKKYIKCELKVDKHGKRYRKIDFRGECSIDLEYMLSVLFDMDLDGLVDCISSPTYDGWESELVAFDVEGENIEISSPLDTTRIFVPEASCYVGLGSIPYDLKKIDFENIVNNYKLLFDKNVLSFYLILLSNNKVVLQQNLDDNGLKVPTKWLDLAKVAFVKQESLYKTVEITSEDLSSLYSLRFSLNTPQRLFEIHPQITDESKMIPGMSVKDLNHIVKEWNVLKDEDSPVYFIKQEDGSIAVRKSILDLKYIKMALHEPGKYEIVDEYGIEVFDFLEEFVLGFSLEDFLAKNPSKSAVSCKCGNIDITYSEKENYAFLNLGKVPDKYLYVERDRTRYKEDRSVKMKLDYFRGLVSYWFSLKQKQVPEIYFTQKEDGAIVIRESIDD